MSILKQYWTLIFAAYFRMPERVLKPEDFDQRNRGKSWMPQLGFQKHSGYRGDRKDSSAANRMLRFVLKLGNLHFQLIFLIKLLLYVARLQKIMYTNFVYSFIIEGINFHGWRNICIFVDI